MTLDEWMAYGLEQGFILPAPPHSGKVYDVCATHDGVTMTEQEELAWEGGEDWCLHVLRLNPEYRDG